VNIHNKETISFIWIFAHSFFFSICLG
jgi:hypothetical protein